MPIYEYEHDSADQVGECDQRFEVIQSFSDDPLTKCPHCDEPCHRVLSAFAVSNKSMNPLGAKNLEAKGFTKYEKTGDGTYAKAFGKGPSSLGAD